MEKLEGITRVALYARLSHKEKLQGYSIEAQLAELEKYAANMQYKIVGQYVDDGFSARRKDYTSRPSLMRMLDDIKANQIDVVLVMKLDRFSRNLRDFYDLQKIFDEHHVSWKSITEEFDTTTAGGRLYLNISLSFAQHEADRIGDRIRDVNKFKVANGQVTTGHVSIGYKIENSRMVIDQEKAPIIQDMFNHFQKSQCQGETRAYIEREYGLHLDEARFRQMLRREIYKGKLHDNPNFCEPIIPPEQFDAVQAILKKNVRKAPTGKVYLFSGMILCTLCNHKMIIKTSDRQRPHLLYYRCARCWKEHTCSNNSYVNERKLEDYLLANITSWLQEKIAAYELQETQRKKPVPPKKKKNSAALKMSKLKELYLNDLIDLETYKKDYAALKLQLQDELSQPEEPQSLSANITHLREMLQFDWDTNYEQLSRIDKRELWRSLIREIQFDGEHLAIVLK